MLKKIVHSGRKVKRVVDRVRYLVKRQQPDFPTDLPKEDPQQRTASFVLTQTSAPSVFSSSSARQPWTQEETALITVAVAHLDKVPTNSEIRRIFATSIRLEQILRDNPFDRVRNKVHNIFKSRT